MMCTVVRKLAGTGVTHQRHVKRGGGYERHAFLRGGGHVLTSNPTIVLVRPPFPLDQHLPFLTLKYLLDTKQGLVGHVHFL